MSPPAFTRLYEMTGFDLRTFSNNLEKLVLFAGERQEITEDDVAAVLERSKQDPIYVLTGAVSDRNPVQSLELLDHGLRVHLVTRVVGIALPEHKAVPTAQGTLVGDVHHGRRILARQCLGIIHSSFSSAVVSAIMMEV